MAAGTAPVSSPKKSAIWLAPMITAMPMVKPLMTGSGIRRISPPTRSSAASTSSAPAISVAISSPSSPWFWMTL